MSGQEMVTADEAREFAKPGAYLYQQESRRLARTVVALHAEVERLTAERDADRNRINWLVSELEVWQRKSLDRTIEREQQRDRAEAAEERIEKVRARDAVGEEQT